MTSSAKKRVLSGIQPSGDIHIGNYLGALRQWVDLQSQADCFYCIVDLHAITVPYNAEDLRKRRLETAATLLAIGIDPAKSALFMQSDNPDHTELAWLLNCIARIGWLNRMTQFKDKAGKDSEKASAGLYNYPILMAADIIAYRATHVPVGEDQKQHLELARDIVDKFSNDFSDKVFIAPQPLILKQGARIMSLRDGSKKMSKSEISEMSRINLSDSDEQIAKKIRRAKTDPLPLPSSSAQLAKRPEALNLITISAELSGKTLEETLKDYAESSFSELKENLTQQAIDFVAPIREKQKQILADRDQLKAILKDGAERAYATTHPTIKAAKQALGL